MKNFAETPSTNNRLFEAVIFLFWKNVLTIGSIYFIIKERLLGVRIWIKKTQRIR